MSKGYIVLAGTFATLAERVVEIERLRAEGVATTCGGCGVEYVGLWPAVCADCDGPLPDMPANYRRTCSPDGRRVLAVSRFTDITIADAAENHWTFSLRTSGGVVLAGDPGPLEIDPDAPVVTCVLDLTAGARG